MKTTREIAEDLFARSEEVAQREGTTLRALIEDGLRAALAQREQKASDGNCCEQSEEADCH